MEEKDEKPVESVSEEEKVREVDLNSLFPGKERDLNRLFPDEATRRLLYQVKRNKRDIERFIRNLHLEED
jgi:hypothetical protein